MRVEIVYETHPTSVDNERGVATGWLHGELSETGRENARELGARRRDDGIAVVYCSDLGRAVETAVGLQHLLDGVALKEVVGAPFDWRPGWEYEVIRGHGA